MRDIREGALDDTGMSINKVEESLGRVNISLRDSNNSFRDFQDVIMDVAKAWNTYDDVTKADITKSLAGVRQAETLTALFENEQMVLELLGEQYNSTGLDAKRYGDYLDSVEAKQNKTTTAWENMWQATMNSDGIKFLYDLSAALLDAIANAGGLVVALGKIALPALNSLQKIVEMLDKSQEFFDKLGVAGTGFTAGAGRFGQNKGKDIQERIQAEEDKQKQTLSDWTMGEKDTSSTYTKKNYYTEEEKSEGFLPTDPEFKKATEESKKAYDKILDYAVKMIKQRKNAEKDAIKEQINDLKDYYDLQQDQLKFQYDLEKRNREQRKTNLKNDLDDFKYYIKQRKDALQDEYEAAERARNAEKDALKDRLDGYKKLIDNQIALLRAKQDEINFNRDMEDKQENLAKLQAQILELSLDDSAEAIAQRMELEEQAAELQEQIDEANVDRQIELQIEALEKQKQIAQDEYDLQMKVIEAAQEAAKIEFDLKTKQLEKSIEVAEREYELKIRAIEQEQENADLAYEIRKRQLEDEFKLKEDNLQKQIDQIEKYLDEEGTMNRDAMEMIAKDGENTYKELIEWNKVYGDGVAQTITDAWNSAQQAMEEYKRSLLELQNTPINIPLPQNNQQPVGETVAYHDGIERGLVGGLKPNEVFAKLTKGEGVVTPKQMDNIITNFGKVPQIQKTNNQNSLSVEIPITVQGNLDNTVLPELERMITAVVNRLNKNVLDRGYVRNTSLTAI